MPLSRRRGSGGEGLNAWPGYVDALSTLLMVIIFVLLVFVLAQAFLSVALSGKDKSLDRLHRQINRISNMLSLEQSHSSDLKTALAQATRDLRVASQEKDSLNLSVANLQTSVNQAVSQRDQTAAERDRLIAQLSDSKTEASAAESRNKALQTQVASQAATIQDTRNTLAARAAALAQLDQQMQTVTTARDKLTAALADTTAKQQALQAHQTALNATITAANEAIAARQTALATVNQKLEATTAKSEQLAAQLSGAQAKEAASEAQNQALQAQVSDLGAKAAAAQAAIAARQADIGALTQQLQAETTSKDNLAAKLSDTQAQQQAAETRNQQLQSQVTDLNATVQANKETIEAKVGDLAKLNADLKALTALRDELQQKAETAAAHATTEQQRRAAIAAELAEARDLGQSARAQVALLNQQIEQLRDQLQSVQAALDVSTTTEKRKDLKIADLGNKLNVALASKVEELKQYRSEFFGRLRQLLAGEKGIQIVGDRFVFQSEVLFPLDSADMTQDGKNQLDGLAATLLQITQKIPPDLPWILRVDGHADKQPITGGQFASNWQLSAQRAINVVKLLINDGIPSNHVAAVAFGDTQPLVKGDTPDDYAKNRRIEFRLDSY